jgi:CRISPR system Cascade subunit CasC
MGPAQLGAGLLGRSTERESRRHGISRRDRVSTVAGHRVRRGIDSTERKDSMFVELHMLQNFAPSNLNRDDTGSPKDCEFGGYRRARISSQCIKRAIREEFRRQHLLPSENLASRTRRITHELARRLQEHGKDSTEAKVVAETLLGGLGLTVDDASNTQYLLFVGDQEIAALVALCDTEWDELRGIADAAIKAEQKDASAAQQKKSKQAAKQAVPNHVKNAAKAALDGGRAGDLALFGRMLADLPVRNIDAASQVAHAISTNRISMEFDFYTAIDDFRPEDTQGAEMMGTVEFNSACFYRYANADLRELLRNLGGDTDVARKTLQSYIRASIDAVPSGKQNSMAAHNPPSFVLAVVRDAGLWSLANAFLQPVSPGRDGDLVDESIRALDRYWGELTAMYGSSAIAGTRAASMNGNGLQHLVGARVGSVQELIDGVVQASRFEDTVERSA